MDKTFRIKIVGKKFCSRNHLTIKLCQFCFVVCLYKYRNKLCAWQRSSYRLIQIGACVSKLSEVFISNALESDIYKYFVSLGFKSSLSKESLVRSLMEFVLCFFENIVISASFWYDNPFTRTVKFWNYFCTCFCYKDRKVFNMPVVKS